jgi:hypothetical protein
LWQLCGLEGAVLIKEIFKLIGEERALVDGVKCWILWDVHSLVSVAEGDKGSLNALSRRISLDNSSPRPQVSIASHIL